MSDEDEGEATQQTQPKKGAPSEIPVPTRGDVFRDLEKVAKKSEADEQDQSSSSSSK